MNFIGKKQQDFQEYLSFRNMSAEGQNNNDAAAAAVAAGKGRQASAKGWNGPAGLELLKMAKKHGIDEMTSEQDAKWKACNAELNNGRGISANRDHLKDMLTDVKTAMSHHSGESAKENPNATKARPSRNDPEGKPKDFDDFRREHDEFSKEVFDLAFALSKDAWQSEGFKSTTKWWDEETFKYAAWCNWTNLNTSTAGTAKGKATESGHKFTQEQEARAKDAEERKRKREEDEERDKEDKRKIAKASEAMSDKLGDITDTFKDLVKAINTPSPAVGGAASAAADQRFVTIEGRIDALDGKLDKLLELAMRKNE